MQRPQDSNDRATMGHLRDSSAVATSVTDSSSSGDTQVDRHGQDVPHHKGDPVPPAPEWTSSSATSSLTLNGNHFQDQNHDHGEYELRDDKDDADGDANRTRESHGDGHGGEGDADDDAILNLAISQTATRMLSHLTPAPEKAAAIERGGGYFTLRDDEEEAGEDSPKEARDSKHQDLDQERVRDEDDSASPWTRREQQHPIRDVPAASWASRLDIEPWHPGPRPLTINTRPTRQSTSPRAGIFTTARKSSISSSADALKRLIPKGLPSIGIVSNLLGPRSGRSSPTANNHAPKTTSSSVDASSSTTAATAQESPISAQQVPANPDITSARPRALRRVTSDSSLLYMTASRVPSLGDDERFVSQREQVNARAKAIRDTWQERSSFRLPHLTVPSILETKAASKSLDAGTTVLSGLERAASVLDAAVENLTGDVVILGGYRGSVLRSTADGRQVWIPVCHWPGWRIAQVYRSVPLLIGSQVKVGLNIRKVNLECGLEAEDEEKMESTIYPDGMLKSIGPIDISRRLFKRLRNCPNALNGSLRIWDFGYDWRLSPALLSRKLETFLRGLPCNASTIDAPHQGALVIAHSLGGLMTRHVINRQPRLFSGVIFAGVPKSCVNILGPLRNGDAVLLSSRILTAQVNFTLRTSYALLPLDGRCFIDVNTGEEYPVDFFIVDDWIKYRWSPCVEPPQPSRSTGSGSLVGILGKSSSFLTLPITKSSKTSGSSSPLPSSPSTQQQQKTLPSSKAKLAADHDTLDQTESAASRAADTIHQAAGTTKNRGLDPQMNNAASSVGTSITIPRDQAIAYLTRTLAEIKRFKQELAYQPHLGGPSNNRYPPMAVIYGKTVPTCNGARVDGRAGIALADAYDKLAFASGDGVVLAREAMLPEGHCAVRGGIIASDRGHISLLGDLQAVGRAIDAVTRGRRRGIGLGRKYG